VHQFETFRKEAARRVEPLVTVQRQGTIALNAAAYRALDSPAAVELLFHAARRVVGLRPVDTHAPSAFLVRAGGRAGSGPYVLSAATFLRYYDIGTPETVRYPARLEDGVLVVELSADDTVGDGTRSDFGA
jgi:hypothetical protein